MKTDSNHYSLGYLKVNEKPANQLIVLKRQNEIKMEDGKIIDEDVKSRLNQMVDKTLELAKSS